jgi:hypothetical protein
MSVIQYYYVGPYAEWLVLPTQEPQDPSTLTGDALFYNPYDGFIVEIDGVQHYRRCFFPSHEDRPRRPLRTLYVDGPWIGAEDWAQVVPEKEIAWFAKAYRKELQGLGRFYRKQPTLRWGLIAWIR